MTDPKLIEAVAIDGLPELPRPAVCYADHSYPAFSAKQMRAYAQAAITAYEAARGDVVVVPREPTEAMLKAALEKELGRYGTTGDDDLRLAWSVMVAAGEKE